MPQQIVKLSADDNYFVRVSAWLKERFPLANGLFSLMLYFSVAAVIQSDLVLTWTNWMGGILLWAQFFLLRIFDEHKDYEIDLRNHPQRVIQSGVVSLSEIRLLGYIVVALQIAFSLYRGDGLGFPIVAWAAMFGYTCLMGVEFFAREWLQRRLLVYAATHMLVMPLMAIWAAAIAGMSGFDERIIGLAILFFCAGAAYEIVRKIRAPECEIKDIDTYSSVLGYRRASYLVLLFKAGFVASAIALLPWGENAKAAVVALTVVLVLHLWLAYQFFLFCKLPTEKRAKNNEKFSGLYLVGVLGTLIAVWA